MNIYIDPYYFLLVITPRIIETSNTRNLVLPPIGSV